MGTLQIEIEDKGVTGDAILIWDEIEQVLRRSADLVDLNSQCMVNILYRLTFLC